MITLVRKTCYLTHRISDIRRSARAIRSHIVSILSTHCTFCILKKNIGFIFVRSQKLRASENIPISFSCCINFHKLSPNTHTHFRLSQHTDWHVRMHACGSKKRSEKIRFKDRLRVLENPLTFRKPTSIIRAPLLSERLFSHEFR